MDDGRAAIASARPAFTVGGEDRPKLDSGLLRLACGETEAGLAHCEAEFGNWGDAQGGTGFLWFDRATLDFGKDFVVKIGGTTVFDGRIMALEARFPPQAPPTIVVRAEDRLQDLRMTRRTRVFDQVSDADLVQQLANDHGLTPQVDLAGGTHKVLAQVNQSDLALLRSRVFANDGELWLEGKTLHAAKRASRTDAQLELVHGARLRKMEVCADLAHQRTAVRCTGWDVSSKQAVSESAGSSAIASEASGGTSGPQLLQQALGEREDVFAHAVPFDSGAARDWAEAHLRACARRFVRGRGMADADARIRVGRRITLQGLGPLFSGAYGVVEACHRFDLAQGLWTEFVVERPWIGNP
ncbi:phage late control D family protein [Ramlibacter sp. USB13]|uniref:Phage late control D family protein n=1 Tax=Ramlibacter cellulosilyticus TaxID=2764187 RepID=A0A923SB32_9BURK|nr:contractile injection system protein, VgrG/Pvc8 family [Ramlibacter cellulosilyticus]MBC5783430.1 phage late control D family protein [Ramlibacter cellulosilyticus]